MNTTARHQEMTLSAGIVQSADNQRAIPELVSAQAAATPEALAVQCGPEAITYSQLDLRSNKLARYLQSAGVQSENPVGLYVERTSAFVVAALAIIKAGGAYLPIDSGVAGGADRRRFARRSSFGACFTQMETRRTATGNVGHDRP